MVCVRFVVFKISSIQCLLIRTAEVGNLFVIFIGLRPFVISNNPEDIKVWVSLHNTHVCTHPHVHLHNYTLTATHVCAHILVENAYLPKVFGSCVLFFTMNTGRLHYTYMKTV